MVPPGATINVQFRSCGSATCARCADGRKGHGPYWYAYWREDGRLRGKYVGSAATAPLEIRILGTFEVRIRGKVVAGLGGRGGAVRALHALLAVPGHTIRRDRLAAWVSPDAGDATARRALENALGALRRQLHVRGLLCIERYAGPTVRFAPHMGGMALVDWLDADRVEAAAGADLDRAGVVEALQLYGGDMLPGYDYERGTPGEHPVTLGRARLRARRRTLMARAARLAAASGDHEAAASWGETSLAQEPMDQGVVRDLMSAYVELGHRAEALAAFDRLESALEADAVPCDLATWALYDQIAGRRLPAPRGVLIGRERERATIAALLSPGKVGAARLVTVVGPPGAGKSALGLDAGRRCQRLYADGACCVDLSPLRPDARRAVATRAIARAIAGALALGPDSDQPEEGLLAYLRPRAMLLVLDNCDQLFPACGGLAARLLDECPRLRILATSRRALGLSGEVPVELSGLECPPPELGDGRRDLDYPAFRLLVQRAWAAGAAHVSDLPAARLLGRLCRELDGIPLYLELAAGRLRLLDPEALARLMDDGHLALLEGVRGPIDASYALLDAAGAGLLARLAVATDSCTPEAVIALAGGSIGALDTLQILLDSHLVSRLDEGGTSRYTIHQAIREYARERLGDEERAAARAGLLLWCLELARAPGFDRSSPDWLDRLGREQHHLEAALAWASGDLTLADRGLELAFAAGMLWHVRGPRRAGLEALERLLASARGAPAGLRARATRRAAMLANDLGDTARATQLIAEAQALIGEDPDRAELRALSWVNQGGFEVAGDDLASASRLFADARAAFERLADDAGVGAACLGLARVAMRRGDLVEAEGLCRQALAAARAADHLGGQARILTTLGAVLITAGRHAEAIFELETSVPMKERLGDAQGLAVSRINIAEAWRGLGDRRRAAGTLLEVTNARAAIDSPRVAAALLAGVGALAEADGRIEDALRMYGAARTARGDDDGREHLAQAIERCRRRLDAAPAGRALGAGEALGSRDALAMAHALARAMAA